MSFLRENTVNILKYLPEFLQKDVDFKAVGQSCSAEHEKIRLDLQDVFNQFFVETATWGLAAYERILAITARPNDDYTARRSRILSRYQSTQTSTVEFLTVLVKRYMSEDATATVEENNPEYSFRIVTTGGSILYFEDMIEAINLYKPAHLNYAIAIKREIDINAKVGVLNASIGRKKINLPSVPNTTAAITAGVAYVNSGKRSIGIATPTETKVGLYVGNMIHRTGRITIGGIR